MPGKESKMIQIGDEIYIEYDMLFACIFFAILFAFLLFVLVKDIKKERKQRKAEKEEMMHPSEDEIEIYEKAKVVRLDTFLTAETPEHSYIAHDLGFKIEIQTREGEYRTFKLPQEMFEAIKEGDIGTVTVKNGEFYAFRLG